MQQNYFILVLAHSLRGKLRRIRVPLTVVYAVMALALLGCVSLVGLVSSYARMAWKVANYNALRRDVENLRTRYQRLQKVVNQTDQQMASLEMFANEVSVAYGLKQKLEGPSSIGAEGRLVPTFPESLNEFRYLRSYHDAGNSFVRRWHTNVQPSIWPVEGRLMGGYGVRTDPFSGEGAMHTGVDISAPTGTTVRATADGIVSFAAWYNGYGQLVVVSHGGGVETYYAHLSRFSVVEGQEVRRGDPVGAVGSTGRVTAPHLHYEVRIGGAPVNPNSYLSRAGVVQAVKKDFPF
ncbi:MAG: M23 family metallopeptidase [Bryobacteraceae bacterium]|jgi:murein DD-endopeptidase MepM/ murein hydrolase activator NlpD